MSTLEEKEGEVSMSMSKDEEEVDEATTTMLCSNHWMVTLSNGVIDSRKGVIDDEKEREIMSELGEEACLLQALEL